MSEEIKPISIKNGEHYTWGNKCDGWHLVKNDNLSIIQERIPAGESEIKHYHKRSRQFFYIISGQASFEINDLKFIINSNEGIEIPPTVTHKIINESDSELIFLVISQPKSHGDRIIV